MFVIVFIHTRLLPYRLPNCLLVIELRQNQLYPPRLLFSRSFVRSGTFVRVSTSSHVPPGRLGGVYLLLPISQRDPRTCPSLGTVRATYRPTFKRTLLSCDPEIARLTIRCIRPADRDPDYADQRDLRLLLLVDRSRLISFVDFGVVCHSTIVVDLDLAMRNSLEVTCLPTLTGGPNRGSE